MTVLNAGANVVRIADELLQTRAKKNVHLNFQIDGHGPMVVKKFTTPCDGRTFIRSSSSQGCVEMRKAN